MIFALAVAILSGVVTASERLTGLAALDTSRVMAGEFWRVFSGHLAHLSWRQYLVDAPAFVALYATFGKRAGGFAATLLALLAAPAISLAVMVAGIHQVYGGLSGLSFAALAAILLGMMLEQPRRIFPYLVCGSLGVYLLFFEGEASGVRVAHEAHLAGLLTGAVFAIITNRSPIVRGPFRWISRVKR